MAQRDYVARGQKKKKANPPKRSQQVVPWFKVLLAILVVVVFVIGLFYLKNSNVGATNNDVDTETVSSAIDAKPGEVKSPSSAIAVPTNKSTSDTETTDSTAIPELGDEEWEFIEGLPSYSVEVDVEEMPDTGETWNVRCGSFRELERANNMRASIAMLGYEPQMKKSNNSNGTWHVVFIGPYDMKRKADFDRGKLVKGGLRTCQVWKIWD
ncbi:SPOR domain-containing protein [Glaciecola sp. MH2013]|uniref:SPOR domain-containing protein n=1 Tax=Glaciecola sp. MH2013 TaxID=2785524 RepID=UPI00189ECABB|nr:SPOR domain-containing protein [Glaciecola sp. MH2013]MBF7071865.1 SPOR domain-containing protein [Glaciecola sp. MH2013]